MECDCMGMDRMYGQLGLPIAYPTSLLPLPMGNLESNLHHPTHSSTRPTPTDRTFFFTIPSSPPLTTCPPSSLVRFCSPPMLLVYPGARHSPLSPYLLRGSGESPPPSDQPTTQPQATGAHDMGKIRSSPSLGELQRGTSCVKRSLPD